MGYTVPFSSSTEFNLIKKDPEWSTNMDLRCLVPLCAFHTVCSQVPIIEVWAQGA